MTYLFALRVATAGLLVVVVVLSLLGVNNLAVLALVAVGASVMAVVFEPSRSWWGTEAKGLFADRPRLRREIRRDAVRYVVFLGVVVVVSILAVVTGVVDR